MFLTVPFNIIKKSVHELLNVLKFNFSFKARAPEEILRWHASETGGLRQGQETGVGVEEEPTMNQPSGLTFNYHFCLSVQTMPRTPTPTLAAMLRMDPVGIVCLF